MSSRRSRLSEISIFFSEIWKKSVSFRFHERRRHRSYSLKEKKWKYYRPTFYWILECFEIKVVLVAWLMSSIKIICIVWMLFVELYRVNVVCWIISRSGISWDRGDGFQTLKYRVSRLSERFRPWTRKKNFKIVYDLCRISPLLPHHPSLSLSLSIYASSSFT